MCPFTYVSISTRLLVVRGSSNLTIFCYIGVGVAFGALEDFGHDG
jgi:hypothetical protein